MTSCAARHAQSYLGQPHTSIVLGRQGVVLRGHVLLPQVHHVDELSKPIPGTFHRYRLGQEVRNQLRSFKVVDLPRPQASPFSQGIASQPQMSGSPRAIWLLDDGNGGLTVTICNHRGQLCQAQYFPK